MASRWRKVPALLDALPSMGGARRNRGGSVRTCLPARAAWLGRRQPDQGAETQTPGRQGRLAAPDIRYIRFHLLHSRRNFLARHTLDVQEAFLALAAARAAQPRSPGPSKPAAANPAARIRQRGCWR